MSDLTDTARALEAIDVDLTAVEAAVGELQDNAGDVHRKLDHLDNRLTVIQDQMIEGFRLLGAQVRSGRNGAR